MKHKKRLLCLGMALSLCFSANAFAEITIPPIPAGNISTSQSSGAGDGGQTQGPGPSSDNQGQTQGLSPENGQNQGSSPENGQNQSPSPESGQNQGSSPENGQNQGPSPESGQNQGLSPESGGQTQGPGPSQNTGNSDTSSQTGSGQTSNVQPGGAGGGLTYTTAVTNKASGNTDLSVPEIKSASAVLYDATNDRILYEKDANTRYFPASITKLMTALLVIEKSNLNDMVTFSESAVTNLEAGSVTLKLAEGDQVSVRDCLYGLLLKSANEVANGLAEHVAGSVDNFSNMMNEKARALGCTNTHFANPNGLNNSNHYTTAHDMALIAKAAFQNDTLRQINNTLSYTFPATKNAAARTISLGHKMLYPSDARYYEGIVGGKTGYTSLAGNTLVTCVDRNGTRLITVILKSRQTHYEDTKALLDYGFSKVESDKNNTGQNMAAGPGGSQVSSDGNKWVQDSAGWQFVKENGTKAQNECMMIDGALYWFDSNTYMATGWRQQNGGWYYFKSSGAMARSCWVQTEGYWYCVDENGRLYTNTTTPDGYPVDENGIWR